MSDEIREKDDMTFWDHLADLRGTILRIFILVLVLGTGFFCCMRWFFDNVILWPCKPDFPLYRMLGWMRGDGDFIPDMSKIDHAIELVNIKLGTQLMTHISASLAMALAFGFPLIIYFLWQFVSPGLYPKERQGARKAFLFGNLMFYIGIAVGYFIVFPLALRFLNDYTLSDTIANTLTLDSYMDNFYMVTVSMGLVFELPLLAWMLGKMGLLRRSFFRRYRRYAIFAIALLSSIITPTSDLFTLFIVFVPIYILWELSALLVPSETE